MKVLVLLFAALVLIGCTRPLDTAILAANAARGVGDAAAETLQTACTDRYVLARREDVAELDRGCLPAARAYDAYRAAHAALVAAIQVAQLRGTPDAAEVMRLTAALAAAADALGRAMEGVR